MKRRKLYLIGSLRNSEVTSLATYLEDKTGWEVYASWMAAGPEADDYWKKYEQERGNDYVTALQGHAAWQVFKYDKQHIDSSDATCLVLPAGRSGHLELGYSVGVGKPAFILLDGKDDRWDVMYRFATAVLTKPEELIDQLGAIR